MQNPPAQTLVELAQHYDIVPHFHNLEGQLKQASTETLLALLQRLGIDLNSPDEAGARLQEAQHQASQRPVEPVTVCWQPDPPRIELNRQWLNAARALSITIELEDGNNRSLGVEPSEASAHSGSNRVPIELPALPLGRHRVIVEIPGAAASTWLLCAPRKAFAPKPACFGVFAPTYAVRKEGAGTGTFTDLSALVDWAAHRGAHFVGTLPLLPTYLNENFDPSPYSPISRLFWNDFYLDLGEIAQAQGCQSIQSLLSSYHALDSQQAQSAERLIDYRPLAEQRHRILLELSRDFFSRDSGEREAFQRFIAERPEVERYARFRAVMAKHPGYFRQWPSALLASVATTSDFDRPEFDCHQYAQFRTHQQLSVVAREAKARNCGLYLDLPIGTHPNGYDAWYHDNAFVPNANAGAPPDPFFDGGQDWGFAPLHPQAIRKEGYAYVQACLRHHMQMADILRIDHVMGLHRIYCIPSGMPGSAGAYISFHKEELYALVALESARQGCTVVGEDLGTVPPEVRENMNDHGILRMYVGQFSLHNQKPALQPPPAQSLASLNTHDMPPFAAFVRGLDIDDRVALGSLTPEQAKDEHAQREQLVTALRNDLECPGADDLTLLAAILKRLASSEAPYLLVALEDLWLETAAQNVPGTQFERPNWRRRAAHSLNTLEQQPSIITLLSSLTRPSTAS